MDKPITSSEQFTIEANAKRFANSADSERSYKMTSSERKAARDRKREQRARIAQQEDSERLKLEAERDKQRMQQRQEASGLISLFECAPGKLCICYEEQLRTARMFGARLGPTIMPNETVKHFIVRVMRSWVPRGCPLLSVQRHELLDADFRNRAHELAELDPNEFDWMNARDKLIEQFESACTEEYDIPIDPTTLPPVWEA